MGVPKFFRYISERYPCLSDMIQEHQIPEFDYLYLDMNGIVHTCSHPNDSNVHFRISEEEIFKNIFHYTEVLFNMIRPQKLFFMAVDGVAPRAKINQQRGRRFRSAKEMEIQEAKATAKGIELPTEKRFDSNCITPGTLFMAKLNKNLKNFIEYKISTDEAWRKCKVLYSGSEVAGEGEHKIMDFIRYMKTSKDYDFNARHCLYGLDADLIMLGLCSHEPNFSLLREEVKFNKKQKKIATPEETKFCLLHLSLLREYICHEFSSISDKLSFTFDIEKIIDDWVLMGFLVGNDFIPNLPNLHITNGALPVLYCAYKEVLPTLDGYINEAGMLNLERFEKFMERLSRLDIEQFNEYLTDLKYLESKMGKKFNEHKSPICQNVENGETPSSQSINKDTQATGKMSLGHCNDNNDGGDVDVIVDNDHDHDDDDVDDDDDDDDDDGRDDDDDNDDMNDDDGDEDDDIMDDESDNDTHNIEFIQHKKDYYMNKLEYENVDADVLRSQAEGYVRAIQWNLHYYYNGCCSWSWYYPHHYAPYISDIKNFKDLKLEYELEEPFLPFQQLLAVLPAYSKDLLPMAFQSLVEENSPVAYYYPHEFKTDLNGKRQEWEAVVLIPFIDEKVLLDAMQPHLSKLKLEEQERNKHGKMCLYSYTDTKLSVVNANVYFPGFNNHAAAELNFREDIFVPREKLIKGLSPNFNLNIYYPGFPTLRHIQHTSKLQKAKVKVFEHPSTGDNMVLSITPQQIPDLEVLASQLLGNSIYVDWPHLKEALVIGVTDSVQKYSLINPLLGYNKENLKQEEVNGILAVECCQLKMDITSKFMTRFGIRVGDIDILLYTLSSLGGKYVFNAEGKLTFAKQWSDIPTTHSYQTTVRNLSVYCQDLPLYRTIYDVFASGSICFMMGHPHYGALGEVLQDTTDNPNPRRIKISMKLTKEPALQTIKQVHAKLKTRYMAVGFAAQRLGIGRHLFSRITGSVYVMRTSSDDPLEVSKHNIGLNLKFNKPNKEIPGYTKKENGQWLYSIKAVELTRSYMIKCPDLFERLAKIVTNNFQEHELFNKGSTELDDIIAWLKNEIRGMESRTCGVEVVDMELVQQLEQKIDQFLKTQDDTNKAVFMQVKPHLLFKPGLNSNQFAPDQNSQNRLLDRICCVRSGFTVPLGYKGTIIGIERTNNPTDRVYDVLFDQSFTGGLSLSGCSVSRGYRLAITDFINISFGERMEHGNPSSESVENWRQTTAVALNNKKPNQPPKETSQMRTIIKKGLEKVNQNIHLAPDTPMRQTHHTVSVPKSMPQNFPNAPNQSSEFQALWNELHKIQQPIDKLTSTLNSTMMGIPQVSNRNIQAPQDASAYLKAMLKIPDGTAQTSNSLKNQESTSVKSSKTPVQQKNQTGPPPLVQQLFKHARQTEQKRENANPFWYYSCLLRYFSHSKLGMPEYDYNFDDKTGLTTAYIKLQDAIYKGAPCVTRDQAIESVAKKVYKALNLDTVDMSDVRMVERWRNIQPNSCWVQNIRPSMMPMYPPKLPQVPMNTVMPPNFFHPKWNQKLPPSPRVEPTVSYNQGRQQEERSIQNQPKMEVKNNTAFVPLQAQKKSRNFDRKQTPKETKQDMNKHSHPKVQQQKNEKPPSKEEKSEIVYKPREKEFSQPRSFQEPQSTGRSSKPRKSRIAANFGISPLSNGSEPQ